MFLSASVDGCGLHEDGGDKVQARGVCQRGERQVLDARDGGVGRWVGRSGRPVVRQVAGGIGGQTQIRQFIEARDAAGQFAGDVLLAGRASGDVGFSIQWPCQPAAQHQHRRVVFLLQRRGNPEAGAAMQVAVFDEHGEVVAPASARACRAPGLQGVGGRVGGKRERRQAATGVDGVRDGAALVGAVQLPAAQRRHHGDDDSQQDERQPDAAW